MITTENIFNAYTKHNALAASGADIVTERNLHDLMMFALDSDHIDFDGDQIILKQAAPEANAIEIERISGMEDLGSHLAIVTPTSVFILNKRTGDVCVYLPD